MPISFLTTIRNYQANSSQQNSPPHPHSMHPIISIMPHIVIKKINIRNLKAL